MRSQNYLPHFIANATTFFFIETAFKNKKIKNIFLVNQRKVYSLTNRMGRAVKLTPMFRTLFVALPVDNYPLILTVYCT